jgi:putative two-component system response regulator
MTVLRDAPLALILDDDPEVRDLIVEMLRGLGIRAMPVLDPETLVDVAASQRPALIMLDVIMPIIDGYTLATQLRGDARTAPIPIVFMTGQDAPVYRTLSFGLGAVAFLQKPFIETTLRAAVGRALGT